MFRQWRRVNTARCRGAMKRTPLVTGLALAALLHSSRAQQPTFRSSVDFVELDVFVTNSRGTSVKDLTAQDFEILDDGLPQAISSFSFVDLPLPTPTAPTPARTPESDVTQNAGGNDERLWVMLLDAPYIDRGAAYTRRTQNVARGFVDAMGPNDSMAIIHVQGTPRTSQPLTTSRTRLYESIERFSQGAASGGPDSFGPEGVTRIRITFQTIEEVAERLGAISGRRKALLWIGGQMPFDLAKLSDQLLFAYRDMIRAAQRNHVVIYSIDPSGLAGNLLRYQASLRVVAEDTGGLAVVNTNDYTRHFREIVRDNSTYYLVGYSPNPLHRDGEFHNVTVRVKRPGLTVRTRRGYLAPTAAEVPQVTATSVDELTQALRNPVPRRAVSIDIAATPVGSVNTAGAVLITASAHGDAPILDDPQVDVAYRVIDAEGETMAERATTYPLPPSGINSAGRIAVRFTDRVDLPKGRHEIRLAIHMPGGQTGSVVTYVDVPNFKEDRLSLSGLSVEGAAGAGTPVLTGGGSEPSDETVTTDRRFPSFATLRVHARVYGKLERAETLAVTALLRNEAGTTIRENLLVSIQPGERVPQERVASVKVPLSGLPPGTYSLVVNAGTARSRRPSATRHLALQVEAP